MNTSESQNTSDTTRPFGFWLKATDRLMAAEFATAFENEHASRRDWRLLNVIDGTAPARRPLHAHKLQHLVERGWVASDNSSEGTGWTLTDDGRAAKERLGATVDGIRAKVTDAVSAEDMATTLASLEKIARAFGWDEETPLPRGRGHRHGRGFGRNGFGRHGFGGFGHGRGFGHERGRGFGHGEGFGPRHGDGFGPRHGDERGCEHGHRARQRDHGHAAHPYERGFDAGFLRGRDA